jgi:hypothetical protein
LEEDADFPKKQRIRGLFNRPNRTDQTDKGDSARIVRIGLNVFANDQIPNRRMHLAHAVVSEPMVER